jgi:hypothetical protein
MTRLTGKVIFAQEGRFKLRTPDGRCKLFLLANDASHGPQDLNELVGAGEVLVEFSPLTGQIADLAHRVGRVSAR